MIHLVHAGNRALYADALEQMFRLRARFFKDLLGWSALRVVDGQEMDEYDDEQALYLLAIEDDGVISVSVRLRPTSDKSLLADHFPHLLADDIKTVAQPGVWESCRYFANSRARGPAWAGRREELRLAMVELARDRGVNRIVAITDTTFVPALVQASWTTRMLGLPARYDEGECIALEISCSEEAHLRMKERLGSPGDVLLQLPLGIFPNIPPHEIEWFTAAQPLSAKELIQVMALAKSLSDDEAHRLAKVVREVAQIQDEEGSGAALRVINQLAGRGFQQVTKAADAAYLRLVE